jgi:diguanylate cyclase (GGDEF)-like protein/PAS domain S-box-containing protein
MSPSIDIEEIETHQAAEVALVVIEDNPADARLLQEMMLGEGLPRFAVTTFDRLAAAAGHLRSTEAACVLVDLSLPDADGLEAIVSLRSDFPATPIVVVTGLDDEAVAIKALQSGAQDYLIKGRIDADSVRRAVRYAVERKRAETELASLSRKNELILESAGEGICGLDREGVIEFANPAAARMLGRAVDELVGQPVHDVVHVGRGGPEHRAEECPVAAAPPAGQGESAEDSFHRRDGSSFPVERTGTPIVEGTEVTGAVVSFKDITERKRFESRLRHLADHDALTGLFNRRRFEEELSRQLAYAARYELGGAVLLLDLDNFKYVNDALGHGAGDALLRSVAGLLSRRLRDTDVVARLGGDEFAVLLSASGAAEAKQVAEELLSLIRGHSASLGRQPLRVTTSIGVTLMDRPELTPEQLLVEADVAMYEAKYTGRDRVILFGDASAGKGQPGLGWAEQIRVALADESFVVHCQQILPLREKDASVARYELLVRMHGEGEELVLPAAFLPTAERFGLIQSIDAWMVRQAVSLIERRNGTGPSLVLEVNLSGRSIGDPSLLDIVEEELARSGIDPGSLIFEITETAAVANIEEARSFADRLRELGCQFALDDFGAGFGSFYYLKYFPVDYLKLDGEFVQDLPNSTMDQRMVRAMVEIAQGLGLRTIAEYVETAETLELLRSYGVDFAQGFHIGEPAAAHQLIGPS